MLSYDMLHAVPRQSAPDWIKSSPLSTGDANGYVEIDKHTMQHVRNPNVFSLGDAGSSPNSKTGAAIRKQAPVVAENIEAYLAGRPLTACYNGYGSCPIVTSADKMLLAEFDYDLNLTPWLPKSLLDPNPASCPFLRQLLPYADACRAPRTMDLPRPAHCVIVVGERRTTRLSARPGSSSRACRRGDGQVDRRRATSPLIVYANSYCRFLGVSGVPG